MTHKSGCHGDWYPLIEKPGDEAGPEHVSPPAILGQAGIGRSPLDNHGEPLGVEAD
jgi:hypothetical protein